MIELPTIMILYELITKSNKKAQVKMERHWVD